MDPYPSLESTMIIAVVSDSHNHTRHLQAVVDVANGSGCGALLHLGDITTPHSARVLAGFQGEVRAVFGNCDRERSSLRSVFQSMGGRIDLPPSTFEMGNRRFAMMHEPHFLDAMRKTGNLDFILYGHMHAEKVVEEDGVLILNPGECGGGSPVPTCYFLDTETRSAIRVPI